MAAHFGPFVNLVSSCTSTFTSFILPPLFYLKLRGLGGQTGMGPLECLWNVLIAAFSLIMAGFGSVRAFRQLAHPG